MLVSSMVWKSSRKRALYLLQLLHAAQRSMRWREGRSEQWRKRPINVKGCQCVLEILVKQSNMRLHCTIARYQEHPRISHITSFCLEGGTQFQNAIFRMCSIYAHGKNRTQIKCGRTCTAECILGAIDGFFRAYILMANVLCIPYVVFLMQ